MKNIFLILCILFSFSGLSQTDSSQIRISGIVLKGKDYKVIAQIISLDSRNFPTLDSITKAIGGASDSDDITYNSVQNKQWFRIAMKLKEDKVSLLNGVFSRVNNELRLHGSVWVIWRLDNDNIVNSDPLFDNAKKDGQKYAKKQDDDL